MAKYTREQRQRAVELYVKYECCAADVIRELGYPSREALRMWHRDWLDEQGTGVSSQRGERYARYTEEQKRASVDHYLTHGVFCQIEVVQNGVSIQSEKAAGFSPVERKDPPPLLFGFYPIRAWVRLYDSPSNLIILP